jgi:hypothetical protein
VAAPEFYKSGKDHIQTVMTRLEAIGHEHEQALARWMELEEQQ